MIRIFEVDRSEMIVRVVRNKKKGTNLRICVKTLGISKCRLCCLSDRNGNPSKSCTVLRSSFYFCSLLDLDLSLGHLYFTRLNEDIRNKR